MTEAAHVSETYTNRVTTREFLSGESWLGIKPDAVPSRQRVGPLGSTSDTSSKYSSSKPLSGEQKESCLSELVRVRM